MKNAADDRMPNLKRVQDMMKLAAFDTNEVYEIFCEISQSGNLDKTLFEKCFRRIIQLGGGHNNVADKNEVADIISTLFSSFDANNDGVVDPRELAGGVSILCAGNSEEKIRAAFSLFDINDDGYISLKEMTTYLTSVYRVMFTANEGAKKAVGVDPDELGKITAEQAFLDCNLNNDGKLSFEDFKKWYH